MDGKTRVIPYFDLCRIRVFRVQLTGTSQVGINISVKTEPGPLNVQGLGPRTILPASQYVTGLVHALVDSQVSLICR